MSAFARLLRMERVLNNIQRRCEHCRRNPRWVTVAKPTDEYVAPEPCPKCGASAYSVIVIGTPRIPGNREDDMVEADCE